MRHICAAAPDRPRRTPGHRPDNRPFPTLALSPMQTSSAELIEHSFELAAERCPDLTPLVYDRLFRE